MRELQTVPLLGDFDELAYHYISVFVGSPPQALSVIVDTGSSLLAFPCEGCQQCASQHRQFLHRNSSSASPLKCLSTGPDASQEPYCNSCGAFGECGYSRAFSEGSAIGGKFVNDLVRLGPGEEGAGVRVQFGCHQRESGLFLTQEADGIIGMSAGTLALPTALGAGTGAPASFSLCQVTRGGTLTLGGWDPRLWLDPSMALGPPPSTPIRLTPHGLYTVEATGMQLGPGGAGDCAPGAGRASPPCAAWPWMEDSQWFLREPTASAQEAQVQGQPRGVKLRGSQQQPLPSGAVLLPPLTLNAASPPPSTYFVDTGSSYTYVPRSVLNAVMLSIERECWGGGRGGGAGRLLTAARAGYAAQPPPSVQRALQRCNGTRVPTASLPPGQVFCVRLDSAAGALSTFPALSLRLWGGGVLRVPPQNLLLRTPWTSDMHCLQVFPSDEAGGRSVLGTNFMLGLDVGFRFSGGGGGEISARLSWAQARADCLPDETSPVPPPGDPRQWPLHLGSSRAPVRASELLSGSSSSAWAHAGSDIFAPLLAIPVIFFALAFLLRARRNCFSLKKTVLKGV
jgi:hypothetical protein